MGLLIRQGIVLVSFHELLRESRPQLFWLLLLDFGFHYVFLFNVLVEVFLPQLDWNSISLILCHGRFLLGNERCFRVSVAQRLLLLERWVHDVLELVRSLLVLDTRVDGRPVTIILVVSKARIGRFFSSILGD